MTTQDQRERRVWRLYALLTALTIALALATGCTSTTAPVLTPEPSTHTEASDIGAPTPPLVQIIPGGR